MFQQGLNQDIQIFFRGLLSELLLTLQTKEDGTEIKGIKGKEGKIIRMDEMAPNCSHLIIGTHIIKHFLDFSLTCMKRVM